MPGLLPGRGFSASGLPIGLQIGGNLFAGSTVLALAHACEQATGWHMRRPPPMCEPVMSPQRPDASVMATQWDARNSTELRLNDYRLKGGGFRPGTGD